MTALLKPMTTTVTPLAFLNVFGGIVAGIWLAVLGEWGAIGWGLVAIVLSTCGMSMAFLPAVGLDSLGVYFARRGHTLLFSFFALLSSFYTVGTIALWCGLVLYFFALLADASSVIPLLLWSYGIATWPFAWMAAKEGNDDFTSLTAMFSTKAGYVEHRWDGRSDSPAPRLTCMGRPNAPLRRPRLPTVKGYHRV
jgi:hypothetical protein